MWSNAPNILQEIRRIRKKIMLAYFKNKWFKQPTNPPRPTKIKIFIVERTIEIKENVEYILQTPIKQLREEGFIPENCHAVGCEVEFSDGSKTHKDISGTSQ